MKRLVFSYPILMSLAWAAVILVLCATPGQYIPSADWMDLLSVDKLVHAGVFFILTSLLLIVAIKYDQQLPVIVLYVIITVLYGMLMEFLQARYFNSRTADWMDVVANSFGCLVAVFLFKKIRRTFSIPVI